MERQLNFELLRIVCAFSILITHANFWTLGTPMWGGVSTNPSASIFRIILQFACAPATYAFVLISGYFGIRLKAKSLINLFFILSFWMGVLILKNGVHSLKDLNPFVGWFIPSYVSMLIFIPALNAFADLVENDKFLRYLFIVVPIVMLVDSTQLITCFSQGFSTLGLMLAYLVGRYVSKNRDSITVGLRSYISVLVLWVLTFLLFSFVLKEHDMAFLRVAKAISIYTGPFCFLSSLLLFLLFSRLEFKSKIINHIALSAFPVIGYHLDFGYRDMIRSLYNQNDGLVCLFIIATYMIAVFCGIIAIDQIRIFLWNRISKHI